MEYEVEPEPYHNLVLAAETLQDVGQARTQGDLADEIQARLRQVFAKPLNQESDITSLIRRRASAAEALGKIECGQFGAESAFWSLPHGLPIWVKIPAGEFWMGNGKGLDREKPIHKVYLDRYWISLVPITNAQYHFFVNDVGYDIPRHWKGGKVPRGMESHPVVYVTWYDAMAYCRWLKRKLEEVNGKIRIWSMKESTKICLKSGMYDVLLPSEAEWEKAARATKDQSTFPWGDIWQEGYCNTSELGVNKTTPVGIFPEGRSPYGVLEMAGNVWEWTRSQGGNDYPYVIDDGRENLDASNEVTRVVRGGSWFANQDQARCTSRVVRVPVSRNDYYGFRVCVVSHQD